MRIDRVASRILFCLLRAPLGLALAAAGGCSAQALPPSVTLFSDHGEPQYLVADGANLYWTDVAQGTVMQLSKSGGTPITLAIGQVSPEGIAVDGTSVYWANFGAGIGSIMKAPIGGGPVRMLVSAEQGGFGGSPAFDSNTTVYPELNPMDVATDGTWLYWTNSSADGTTPGIMRVPVQGGAVQVLFSGGVDPSELVVDSTAVYWTDLRGGTVMELALGGSGSPVTLASGETAPAGIAVDDTSVYWTDMGKCGFSQASCTANDPAAGIKKVPLSGGTPVTLATGGNPAHLAVGAQIVAWTTGASGEVMAAGLDGSSQRLLYKGIELTAGIVVDTSSIYWDNTMTGKVLMVSRP